MARVISKSTYLEKDEATEEVMESEKCSLFGSLSPSYITRHLFSVYRYSLHGKHRGLIIPLRKFFYQALEA